VTQASPLTAPDHLQHSAAGDDARYEPSLATGGDYISLLKPRVMSLVIFTALVGLIIAPGVWCLASLRSSASRLAPAPPAR
jgi:heme O synthase-like polyprenyltransferase